MFRQDGLRARRRAGPNALPGSPGACLGMRQLDSTSTDMGALLQLSSEETLALQQLLDTHGTESTLLQAVASRLRECQCQSQPDDGSLGGETTGLEDEDGEDDGCIVVDGKCLNVCNVWYVNWHNRCHGRHLWQRVS